VATEPTMSQYVGFNPEAGTSVADEIVRLGMLKLESAATVQFGIAQEF
jgi:hypothetical protein